MAVPVILSITAVLPSVALNLVRVLVAAPCLIVLKVLLSPSPVGRIEGATLELAGAVFSPAVSNALRASS